MKLIDISSGPEYIEVINGESTCNEFVKFKGLLFNNIDLSTLCLNIIWNKFNSSLNSIGDDRVLILTKLYDYI
jgi:hypothetical protein